jgi:DNA-binding NarL/FixJ family response regulator
VRPGNTRFQRHHSSGGIRASERRAEQDIGAERTDEFEMIITGQERRYTLGVCDAQPVTAEGVRAILHDDPVIDWRWSANSIEEARRRYAEQPPELLLLDRSVSATATLHWMRVLSALKVRPRIAVWGTVVSSAEAERLICAGASGVLARTASLLEVLVCLRRLAAEGTWSHPSVMRPGQCPVRRNHLGLTAREQEVFELVQRGLSNREVGANLGISSGTVKIHMQHIFAKTGVRERTRLVAVQAQEQAAAAAAAAGGGFRGAREDVASFSLAKV